MVAIAPSPEYVARFSGGNPGSVGLDAWYPLDETAGSAREIAFGRPVGVQTGNPFGVGAPWGGTWRYFNGSSSRIDCTNFMPTYAVSTVSVWCMPANTSAGTRCVFNQQSSNYYEIQQNGTTLDVYASPDVGPFSTSNVFAANVPVHIALVREGNSVTNGYKLYKNGFLANQTNSGTLSEPATSLAIGWSPNFSGRYWVGAIGQFRHFFRALSPSEILWLYQNPTGAARPTPRRGYVAAGGGGGGFQAAWTRGSNVVLNTRIAA